MTKRTTNSKRKPKESSSRDGISEAGLNFESPAKKKSRNNNKGISSGASTVARSAVSAASSAVRDVESHHDQVLWAGFDKLEKEDGDTRIVLLLPFQSGFQVWDVEDTGNVHVIVSAHDGQASFMQILRNPINSGVLDDRFSESRPLFRTVIIF